MAGLPIHLEKLARRALRTPGSAIETARLLESLAIPGADVALVFQNHPNVTDRELRASLHALADLMRELDRALEPAPSPDARDHGGERTDIKAQPAQSVGSGGPGRSIECAQEGKTHETAATALASKSAKPRSLWSLPGPRNVLVHIDGCSKGNPGPAGIGVQFLTADGKPLAEYCEAIGETTNNVAEYKAMIAALKIALDHGVKRLNAFTDSQLLARQINGQYRVKNPGLKSLFEDVAKLKDQLQAFEITDVRREFNTRADELANLALQNR